MVSHPETGSDSPIGSDRDRGRDRQAPNPGKKKYTRLNERIGHNKPREAQRASNRIYQCMGVIGNMATQSDGHPSSNHDLKRKTSSADPH